MKIYQEKRRNPNPKRNSILQESNTTEAIPRGVYVTPNHHQGKENTLIETLPHPSHPNIHQFDPKQLLPQATSAIHIDTLTHVSLTPEHGVTERANGEDDLCGTIDGNSIPDCGEPPDPHSRSQNGNVDGTRPEAAGVGSQPNATQ